MALCGACVLLAVLAARCIAVASTSSTARGIAAPLTPRPHSDQQLGPPTPSPLPTSATSSGKEDGDKTDDDQEVEGNEGQQLVEEPPSVIRTITTQVKLFMTCVPRWGVSACLKLEALLLLHGESGESVEGFIEGPDSASRQGSFFAELSERPEARDAYLNKMLLRAVEDLLEDAFGFAKEQAERGMRRRRRWSSPLLAVMVGLGSLIVVGGIAKTAMIAGKALALSMLALALAIMMGLRGGGTAGAGGAANYEILASRRRVGVSSPGVQYPSAMYMETSAPSSEQPAALGAQSMAYSGHHTRP